VFGKLYEKGADHARGPEERLRASRLALLPMEHVGDPRERGTG